MWNFFEFYSRLKKDNVQAEALDIERMLKMIRMARQAGSQPATPQPEPTVQKPEAPQPTAAPTAAPAAPQQPAGGEDVEKSLGGLFGKPETPVQPPKKTKAVPATKAPVAAPAPKPQGVEGDLASLFGPEQQGTKTSVEAPKSGPIAPDAERQPRRPRGKTTMTDRQIEKAAENTFPADWPEGLKNYLDKNGIPWEDPSGQGGSILDYMRVSGKRPYVTYPGRGGEAHGGDETRQMFPVVVPKLNIKAAKRAGSKSLRDKREDPGFYDDEGQGQRMGRNRVADAKRFQPLEVQLDDAEKRVWDAMARIGGKTARVKERPDGSMTIMGKRFDFPSLVKAVADEMNARPVGGLGKKVMVTPEEVAPLVISILEKDRVPKQQGYGKRLLQVTHKDDPKGNRLPRTMRIMQGENLGQLTGKSAIGASDIKVTLPFAPRGYDPNKEVEAKAQSPSSVKHTAGSNVPQSGGLGALPGHEEDPLKQRIQQGLAKPKATEPGPDLTVAGYNAILKALDRGDHEQAMKFIDRLEQLHGDLAPIWDQIESKLVNQIAQIRQTNPKKAQEMEDNMLNLMAAIEEREGGTAVEHAVHTMLENVQFRSWTDFYNLMEMSGL